MANKNNKLMVATSLLVVLVVVIFAFIQTPSAPEGKFQSDSAKDLTDISDISRESELAEVELKTIANAWQWQSEASQNSEANSDSKRSEQTVNDGDKTRPFTEQEVYYALRAVKLDEDGHVILDHTALISLDEALERIYGKLDEDNLAVLKNMIKNRLPGLAGEQTAQLVEDYTSFLVAKDEFSRVYEQIDPQEEQSLETLARDEGLYEELQALREVYLGKESTDKLFRVSDANAKFMFETLKIGADESLSAEERSLRLADAQAELDRQTIDIPNWGDRYDSFLTAKQTILDASISDSEKQSQLSSLLQDHFNETEQTKIEHLALDVL